ncbi:MAG: NUDIX domain-containing protein [Verrucomicrobiota bacterium JB023]|nr:NUDIX domain-containing protein [Verrucomicrobiota bacterium JB023]
MPFTYEHARPSVTVDCVVFGFAGEGLQLLLVKRGGEPYEGEWALPGGFVRLDEDLDSAARRELEEETQLRETYLEQLYTFGSPERDPRGRVISVGYYALVRPDRQPVAGGTDAADARWFPLNGLPSLAFDHGEIIKVARDRLQGKIRYQPIGFELLPEKFTLTQIQTLYEAILGCPIDKRNFRKKLLSFGFLEALEEYVRGPHRPARLYRFDQARYSKLQREGILFQI